MNRNPKQKLFEMMMKIDPSFKPRLNENIGSILNEDRTVYNNLLQMFQENNLKAGMFIAVGYVNAVDIPKRVFPTNANEEYANKLILAAEQNGLSEFEIKLLKEFISDEIWAKTKAGEIQLKSKKEPKRFFELDNRFSSMIQFDRYVFNYQDRNSLSKNFQDKKDSEMELRRKFGFGKGEDQYPEDDWRRKIGKTDRPKYRGVGVEPLIDPKDANKGSTYIDKMGDLPLYGDTDVEGNPRTDPETGYQRIALRQNISSGIKKQDTDYFLVDEQGNLNPVSQNFVDFFTKYIKEVRETTIEVLQDEEEAFVREMKKLEGRFYSTQFISERIAYITATVEDSKSKEKKPIYFYNDKLDVVQKFPVNIQQLQNHINQYMKDSFNTAKDVANMQESLIVKKESKQRLFEAMHKVTGIPLNENNEYYDVISHNRSNGKTTYEEKALTYEKAEQLKNDILSMAKDAGWDIDVNIEPSQITPKEANKEWNRKVQATYNLRRR